MWAEERTGIVTSEWRRPAWNEFGVKGGMNAKNYGENEIAFPNNIWQENPQVARNKRSLRGTP